MANPIEKRKEKIKPKKLFSIIIHIWSDGVLSGGGIEYRNLGRLKNQKMIVPDKDDFLACVRSILPSTVATIEPVLEAVYGDVDCEDMDGCEKIAKVTVDIYSDGYIDSDFSEIIKGNRGAPKNWRLAPNEFVRTVEGRLGKLSESFRPLISAPIPGEVKGELVKNDDEEEKDHKHIS